MKQMKAAAIKYPQTIWCEWVTIAATNMIKPTIKNFMEVF